MTVKGTDFYYIAMTGLKPLMPQIKNKYGKYWVTACRNIYGVDDLNPRFDGVYETPWGERPNEFYKPPELIHINDSLNDILDARAIEVNEFAKSTNRKLAVMWSGGIDSTTLLVALLKNLSPADQKNIVIHMSSDIINENPEFYQRFVAGKFECVSSHNFNLNNEFLSTHLMLHGDPADGIFGPGLAMIKPFFPDGSNKSLWKNQIDKIVDGIVAFKHLHKHAGPSADVDDHEWGYWYTNKLAHNIETSVARDFVFTVEDFWWWNYFNIKYECVAQQHALLDYKRYYTEDISHENYVAYVKNTFFHTDKFQLWSYSNKDTLYGNGGQSHKLAAKQYIYEFDKNDDYLENKRKMPSVKGKYWRHANPACFSKLWRAYRFDNPLVKDWLVDCLENYKG